MAKGNQQTHPETQTELTGEKLSVKANLQILEEETTYSNADTNIRDKES